MSGSRGLLSVAAIDIVAVLVFATLGRASHQEGLSPAGVAGTAWPFLLGLAIGWAILAARGAVRRGIVAQVGPGVTVWLCTWILGLVARRLFTDGGVQFSFVLVAGTFLALFLLGPRWLRSRAGASRPVGDREDGSGPP